MAQKGGVLAVRHKCMGGKCLFVIRKKMFSWIFANLCRMISRIWQRMAGMGIKQGANGYFLCDLSCRNKLIIFCKKPHTKISWALIQQLCWLSFGTLIKYNDIREYYHTPKINGRVKEVDMSCLKYNSQSIRGIFYSWE